jgi:ATP-binding cassette subfamily F protein 3
LALEHRKLSITPGGYDDWLRLRAAKLAQLESQRTKQAAERAHLQAFVDRFRAKASKARQAQSRVKMLEKMQDVSIPIAERTTPFLFPAPESKLSPPLLEIKGAELGYGPGARILNNVDIRLDPDDRIAIVGTNGQGKTTLVKSIAERLPLMSGKRLAPKAVRIGYFSQDQLDELTAGDTLLQHVMRALPKDTPPPKQRSVAAQMGFSHEKVETKVEALSGGEKVRLILGLIALEKPHILILDEPTSHLDIDSREALIYAINDFPGAVLLITHDVYLAEATADALWLVKDGKVSPYDGDLNDYRTLVLSTDREKASSAKAAAASDEGGDKAEARRKASAAREAAAPLKKKAQDAEKTMERLAAKIAALDVEVARPDIQPHEVRQRLKERAKFVAEREAAEATWLEASEAYEAAVR